MKALERPEPIGATAMAGDEHNPEESTRSKWRSRYGLRHKWQRITEFPPGIRPPRKVRIYRRDRHYLLNTWDPRQRKNVSVRVEGDLVDAVAKARELEVRIDEVQDTGIGRKRCRQSELIESYTADLSRRVAAGEIDQRTAIRYHSALEHYRRFTGQSDAARQFAYASRTDRGLAQEFRAYLQSVQISPNGHPHARKRTMVASAYVESVVGGMFAWAADPERGALLPYGFRNPFTGLSRQSTAVAVDPLRPPDITVEMAVEFLSRCDRFQLPIFALLALYGLRPSELCFLFREHVTQGWLDCSCNPALDYVTKGRRNKRLPLIPELPPPLAPVETDMGLLFVRRRVAEGHVRSNLFGWSAEMLQREFQARCGGTSGLRVNDRRSIRDALLNDAGAVSYDEIEHEFKSVIRTLRWPKAATLKDFRHLVNTMLQNSGTPDLYRRYILGHSLGRTALVSYTHLDDIERHYRAALDSTMSPIMASIHQRATELNV